MIWILLVIAVFAAYNLFLISAYLRAIHSAICGVAYIHAQSAAGNDLTAVAEALGGKVDGAQK